jgi:predicted secreted protein
MPRHTLSATDNERRVLVAGGDEIVILLPEKATAGYEWEITQIPEGVEVQIERHEADLSMNAGADAMTSMHVIINRAVRGRLVARHRQPWNPADPSATSFSIDLEPA